MARIRSEERREGLARAIKVLRVERGISRSELADAAGISYSHLSEIENGNKEPSPARYADIAEALELSRSELVALQEAYTEGEQPVAEEITRPERPRPTRGKSFVVPLMGGEWEAMPGETEPSRATPSRTRSAPAGGRRSAAHPSRMAEEERRQILGDLVLTLQSLPPEDLSRLLDFARGLSAKR
jgi:transcriptional regulator with XRE-family HTH domain